MDDQPSERRCLARTFRRHDALVPKFVMFQCCDGVYQMSGGKAAADVFMQQWVHSVQTLRILLREPDQCIVAVVVSVESWPLVT